MRTLTHTCVANSPIIGFLRWTSCVVIDFSAAETGGMALLSQDTHTHTKNCGTYQYPRSVIWDISSVKRSIRLCFRKSGRKESGSQGGEEWHAGISSLPSTACSSPSPKAPREPEPKLKRKTGRLPAHRWHCVPCRYPYHSLTPVQHS